MTTSRYEKLPKYYLGRGKVAKMIGETTYKITVSRADSDVIKNLVDILENCPMGLNNDDYVEIMKTIAYHNYETDIEGVEIEYEEDSII